MKFFTFFLLLLTPSIAFATGDTGMLGFFNTIELYFKEVILFFTDTIPLTIASFFVYLKAYVLYLKFYFMYQGLQFSHAVALEFLELINITEVVNSAISYLPSDIRQAASDMRFFEALTLLVEALITRMVYQGGSS